MCNKKNVSKKSEKNAPVGTIGKKTKIKYIKFPSLVVFILELRILIFEKINL